MDKSSAGEANRNKNGKELSEPDGGRRLEHIEVLQNVWHCH